MTEDMSNVDRNWFSKHADTITLMATLLGGFMWIDSKFTGVDGKFDKINERLSTVEKDVAVIKNLKIDERLASIEKDMTIIKTVLSMKGINCNELAKQEDKK